MDIPGLSHREIAKRAFFTTGGPGVGKTTLIMEAVKFLGKRCDGFFTEEMRSHGVREGFRIVSLDGNKGTLAHVGLPSSHRVGKYGVDVESLDRVGVAAIRSATDEKDIVVVDEVGKMELASVAFRSALLDALESGKNVMGTIMLASHPFADAIKGRPDVEVVLLTRANSEEVKGKLHRWLELSRETPAHE
ncbi:MAG: NTPase [Chloroflexi bacterium]|nr:NTPase [Chloroflexota bacterium]